MIGAWMGLVIASGWAQDPTAPACDVVVRATLFDGSEETPGQGVRWEGGRITHIGASVPSSGCTVHAAAWITPPFVAVGTGTGLMGVELEPSSRDDGGPADAVHPSFTPALAYDPRSVVVPVTRLGGIGSAVVVPTAAFVAGGAGLVSLVTGTQAEAMVAQRVGVVVHPNQPGSLAEGLGQLGVLVDDARRIAASRDPYANADAWVAPRVELAALAPVVRGEQPWIVYADRASDLEAILDTASRTQTQVVVFGGAEAWLLADRLAAAKVPVFVDPFVMGAGSFDQLRGRPDNAALLAAAGVEVGVLAPETHNARAVRFVAGNAVRAGLPHDAALRALTSVPATTFQHPERGRIQVGDVAQLALWSADPLDTPGRLLGLTIDGAAQPLTSRQTELVDTWRTLPRDLLPGLPAGAVAP